MTAPIVAFETLDSTNAEARRRAEAGEAGPLWITSLRQTGGRGRRGRIWETGEGNLAATYLFSTDKPPAEAAQVSFVAALAVHELATTILGLGGVVASLKWPNDLLLDGRKAAGILVESGKFGDCLWVAVGIGVNLAVAPEPAPDAAISPTSFQAEGVAPPSPGDAVQILGGAMARWLDLWNTTGFAAIADAWTARAHGLGQRCVARLPAETVQGLAEGLDADGALRLRLADGGVRRITAGDVYFGGN